MHLFSRNVLFLSTVFLILVLSVPLLSGKYLLKREKQLIIEDLVYLVRMCETECAEDIDPNKLIEEAISTMLLNLDPHSHFLNEKEFARMMEEQKGSFYGIGVAVRIMNEKLVVVSPIPGTPAGRAGLRAGDIIAKIDGEPTQGKPIDELLKRLRGPKGTKVRLTIVRPGYDQPFDVVIIRDEIPLTTVSYSFMVNESTGYVRIKSFGEKTYDELNKALRELRSQGMKALVLDLRGNTGGLLLQAVEILDLFLPPGYTLVELRGQGLETKITYTSDQRDPYEDIPLLVLVNQGSASASEIVAGALQDHDRAIIIGKPTWGKGLVQTMFQLSFHTALALTTGRYYTPSGRLIQRSYQSYFQYIFPEIYSSAHKLQVQNSYRTDLGRKVLAGGGILPDIVVDELKWPPIVQRFYIHSAFFEFAKKFEPVDLKSMPGNSHRRKLAKTFDVDHALLSEFREFLKEKDIPYTEEEFKENEEWIKRALKKELLDNLWGEQEGYQYIIQFDPVLRYALNTIERARTLWVKAQVKHKTRNKST